MTSCSKVPTSSRKLWRTDKRSDRRIAGHNKPMGPQRWGKGPNKIRCIGSICLIHKEKMQFSAWTTNTCKVFVKSGGKYWFNILCLTIFLNYIQKSLCNHLRIIQLGLFSLEKLHWRPKIKLKKNLIFWNFAQKYINF